MKTFIAFMGASILATAVLAAEAAQNETLRISADGVQGKVMDASGKAVSGVAITLASKSGDAIKSATDEAGAFRFGTLAEGTYRMDIGGRLALDVEVAKKAQVNDLKVVYPEKDIKGAAVEWTPLIAGGVIVVTSVSVMAVVGSESRTVSP